MVTYTQVARGIREAAQEFKDQKRIDIFLRLNSMAKDAEIVTAVTNRINAKTNLPTTASNKEV